VFPTISIGPLVLPTAGLVYIFGAWTVLSVIERCARRLALDAELTYALATTALASGFAGARLTFVLLHWSAYRENLSGILWPLTSGFNLWGGLLIGLIAAFFYGRAKRFPPARTMDALAPGIIFGFMVISLADFLAGPGYGLTTDLPWGIDVYGIRRHPVQLYELFFGVVALLGWLHGSKRMPGLDGTLFLMSTSIYSGGRLFVDAFRANTPLTEGGYHIIQLASFLALLGSVYLLGRLVAVEETVPAAGES
jgi:phosphatidylglycerol:prolipoprotein diacylglycerol transferase